MAKLVTKFKYLNGKSNGRAARYAKYVGTREGVEKIDESYKLAPATKRQGNMIAKIVKDFPDTKDMHEYTDYLNNRTVGNASEFISRALEDNAEEMLEMKTYADYIATRPRAERFGSHGLFTDDGVEVKLQEVSDSIRKYEGNIWTVVISLRREDAERLGFATGERWRDMLRSQTATLAENFKIPLKDLHWYAAFHNEGHHPHVHLMVYSEKKQDAYLTRNGIMKMRSAFAKDIFGQDLMLSYKKQTEIRDDLRAESKQAIAEIVSQINAGVYHNPKIEEQLTELADLLSRTSGKKQYGYLKPEAKANVNRIVMELSEDERIAKLYDLWYEQTEEIRRTYTSEMPKRIPLVDNKEFTSVKNAVINEALNLLAGHYVVEELSDDDDEPEPVTTDYESTDPPHEPTEYDRLLFKAKTGNKWSQYALAKLLLDHESEYFNPDKAVEWLIESAQQNYTVAKYKLGKIFLKGEDVPKDVEYALRWLEEAVEDENSYAEYLLGKTYLNGADVEQDLLYAEDLLRLSIQHQNKYAKYALGKELLSGESITQNIPEGLELLKESAGAGFSAAQYLYGKLLYKGELLPKDIDRAIAHIESAAEQDNPYASYLAGKIRLTEDTVRDIQKAIQHFETAAESGNHYAEYQLGKIYLYGKNVPRDYDKGMEYLRASAEHGNQYAEQLIHSIESNRNWSSAMGSIRLLHHLSRMLQQQMEERDKAKFGQIDRKLKRKIDEKKEAQGLRQG